MEPDDADPQWWVACDDPFGRARSVAVLIGDGHVRLVAPPGEAAVLSALQTHRLDQALHGAARTVAGQPPHPRRTDDPSGQNHA